jgi:hypothetical protein
LDQEAAFSVNWGINVAKTADGGNKGRTAAVLVGQSMPGPSANAAFDRWLTHHLGRLYDPVVREPLPQELMRILEIVAK